MGLSKTNVVTPQSEKKVENEPQKASETKKQEDDEAISKEKLWRGAVDVKLGNGALVQMTGLESASHTAYARVVGEVSASIGKVVEGVVDEGWKRVVKDILEHKEHVEVDSHPPAAHLLRLGAVWLVNETEWTHANGAHAHRLYPKDQERVPEWKDFTLRVYFVPDRFFVANEVDWKHYCKGLLLDKTVQVKIGEETPHIPVLPDGLPDAKDGVIVYEDHNLGFAIVNKPGSMPVHATLSNHAEDVISMYRKALQERREQEDHNGDRKKLFVAVPQRHSSTLDTHTNGLLAISTNHEFATYFSHLFDKTGSVSKRFKCLVCVKDADNMSNLEKFQADGTIVTHYVDHKSPTPKRFVRNMPHKPAKKSEWQKCEMRILQVGDDQFRAACVKSKYKKSVDTTLGKLLWGPNQPEDVQYVMEVQLELVSNARSHQIRGQLAALGFPIVGDVQYGGGKCEIHSHKHCWNRMALQCCELAFPEPKWNDDKKKLIASDTQCVFTINDAFYSEHLRRYEMHHQSY